LPQLGDAEALERCDFVDDVQFHGDVPFGRESKRSTHVDSEPHFGPKLKAIRDKKGRFFLRKSVVGWGRMTREKIGVFSGNLAYYEEKWGRESTLS
jgi:hypothetical protein